MNYKFVFFGTPRFAEIVLETLIEKELTPSLVICNPDRPFGRKKIITPPPTKVLAEKYNIPISQPETLKGYEFPGGEYDFAVVAAYGKIIPKEILEIPKFGTIGVHPSLLPKYRGATPIQSVILNGEKETGLSLYLMDEKMDHGKILKQSSLNIENGETYLSLEKKLGILGGKLVAETIPLYLSEKITPEEQNHDEATFTKKMTTEDAFVPYEYLECALKGSCEKSEEIERKVRALTPEPGVWTINNGKRMKILETKIMEKKIMLTKIQMEGKKPQEIS